MEIFQFMIVIKNKSNCCGCGVCETICPRKCISLCQDEEGFSYPIINKELCINCDTCERACPVLHPPIINLSDNQMYACSSYDTDSKLNSSSGGAFYLLASSIISNGGIVFGVKMSQDYRFSLFTSISSNKELFSILGSKYIQARTERIYKTVNQELESGKLVLFSGTPCHIAALKNYLNKKYDNLFLVDLSCHGVPSEKAWNYYLDCKEEKENAKVVSASFRNKESGWKEFSLSTDYSNGSHHAETFTKDSFGKAFNKRLLFRPSCEHCRFKGLNRWSDLTLADFWGIDEITDAFADCKGTSLIIVHTEKGARMIENIRNLAKIIPVSHEQGTRRNPYIYRSVVPHSNKKKFFELLENESFDDLVEQYATDEFVLKDFIFDLMKYIKRKLGINK